MVKLAWRNLVQERARLWISVAGIAFALVLILIIGGIFAGSEEYAVAYINNVPAPLWLAQTGVENMHMSSSYLPPETARMVETIPGVEDQAGVLYGGGGVGIGDATVSSYIIGVDAATSLGGPWDLVEGSRRIGTDEVIVDYLLADRYELQLGDTVRLFDRDLVIVGLSRGTFGIATSIAFVNKAFLAEVMGIPPDSAAYILIRPEPGEDLVKLAETLSAQIPNADVLTQSELASSDKELIRQMGADIIRAMSFIAYVVGMLVIGLTIYIGTLERAREYGVLKAIGANNAQLSGVVLAQSFLSAALGIILGVAIAFLAAALITWIYPDMLVLIRPYEIIRQIPILIFVTGVAALLPLSRIATLDPMIAFKA